jgi:hypothetical protein
MNKDILLNGASPMKLNIAVVFAWTKTKAFCPKIKAPPILPEGERTYLDYAFD